MAKRFAALDTGTLLGLGQGSDDCQGTVDILGRIGFYFLATETVLQELADVVAVERDAAECKLARATLTQLTNFGVIAPSLSPVLMGVCEQFAERLCERKIVPTKNDGLVVAEAACNECQLLVTTRAELLDADHDSLRLALVEADLSPIIVVSPGQIVQYFSKADAERGDWSSHS